MYKAYKVEIKPNKKQLELFNKASGIARFIYNWALDQRIKYYKETKKSLSYAKQNLELTKLKHEYSDWMYEVGKFVHQNALRNLQTAFDNFFRSVKKKQDVGYTKFKSKHKSKKSFTIDNEYKNTHLERQGFKWVSRGKISFVTKTIMAVGLTETEKKSKRNYEIENLSEMMKKNL